MKITICFCVTSALIVCNVFKKNQQIKCANYLLLLLFFDLFANIGSIGKIGGFEIQYVDLVWIFISVYAIKNRIDAKDFTKITLFLASISITIILESISPVIFEDNLARSILVSVRMIMCLSTFIGIKLTWYNGTKELFSRQLLTLQNIYYAILFIEIVFKYVFHSNFLNEVTSVIFGVGENQVTWLISRGGLYALQGLCKEPSHLAIMLLFVSIYDIAAIDNQLILRKYLLINIALLIISGSLAGMLYAAIILFALANTGKRQLGWIVSAGLLMALSTILVLFADKIPVFSYYFNRLNNSIGFLRGINIGYSSESERLKGLIGSYKFIEQRPIFGIGPGNNVLTCALPALVSTIGIAGTISYIACFIQRNANGLKWSMIVGFVIALVFTMDMGVFYSGAFLIAALCNSNELNNKISDI